MNIGPTIIIDIDPEYFLFTKGENQIKQATYVNLEKREESYIPVQIGENKEILGSILCPLFRHEVDLAQEINKFSLLEIFLEYAFENLSGHSVVILIGRYIFSSLRPVVIFKGDHKLFKQLGGYQRYILSRAAIEAGARKVIFE